MFSVDQIYSILGGAGGPGEGFSYGLHDGNKIEKLLNTPNLWGHNPSITDYVPAAQNLELPPKDRTCSGLRLRADELAR